MTFDFDSELRAALGPGYELERELTGSGMSRVFVALERELSRRVVIKVLPPELAAGVNRERFRREIQLAAQLQHPHIVPLHTAGARGDLLYFTMPFIEGESLRYALAEGQRFAPREVVRILHDVSDALAYAHARGVIHRDIKPGNVLRSGSHAVVTDFGVAKAISAALPAAGMTTSGMAIGTPQYMAPEQLAGDPAADHRVDIYALGLLGYELLAGEVPFKAPSPQETMAAQLTRVPEPLSKMRSDVPPALATLIARCLAKSPSDRPQSASEVSALLDEMDVASGSRMVHAPSSKRGMLVGMGLGLALVAAFAVWMASHPAPAPPVAAPDTVVAPPPPPARAALTREDSLAIAAAIERKFVEQRAATRALAESTRTAATPPAPVSAPTQDAINQQVARMADSLREAIQKSVLDSVTRVRGRRPDIEAFVGATVAAESLRRLVAPFEFRAEDRTPRRRDDLSPPAFADRAANMGPPRRVFISTPRLTSRASLLAGVADSLTDSLRRAIERNPRYLVIDADSTRQMLERTRTISTIARTMDVDLFTSLVVSMLPDSSVMWNVTVRDLSAVSAYSMRAMAVKSDPGAPLSAVDKLVTASVQFLGDMDRAPRAPVGPAPPPRP